MRLTKSILRPLRATRILSRRRAPPFFTKKRGGENEPSSPKVTCIGQVRSKKSKRRVKRCRSVSSRPPRVLGEASFGNGGDQRRNDDKKIIYSGSQRYSNGSSAHYQPSQRWVHLPISVCDALRAFGAEFGRLFLCRRSCCFSSREREKVDGGGNGSWVVSVSEGTRRREIEVVVDDAAVEGRMSFKSSRRHVFEDVEVKDGDEDEEEEEGRVSISIPPKNALILMRCRSDPVKMADLAHRLSWDAASKCQNGDVVEEDEMHGDETVLDFEEVRGLMCEGKDEIFLVKESDAAEVFEQDFQITDKLDEEEEEEESKNDAETNCCVQEVSEGELVIASEERESGIDANGDEEALVVEVERQEVESNISSFEALLVRENTEHDEQHYPIQASEEVKEEETPICHFSSSAESDKEINGGNEVASSLPEEKKATTEREKQEETEENENESKEERERPQALPECLILMMREPKLSMEVSKETWVRGTDFIRRLPRRPAKAGGCGHEPVKRPPYKAKPSVPAPPSRKCDQLPPRSSCSLPVGKVTEPLVLTRCKSEPMRTAAAAKLAPESCLWKNGGEPHGRTTIGVGAGAAGVGC